MCDEEPRTWARGAVVTIPVCLGRVKTLEGTPRAERQNDALLVVLGRHSALGSSGAGSADQGLFDRGPAAWPDAARILDDEDDGTEQAVCERGRWSGRWYVGEP